MAILGRPCVLFNTQTHSRVFGLNPISSAGRRSRISLPSANEFNIFGPTKLGSEQLGLRSFRVSSGGGDSGGFRNSGGGGGGGGGDDGDNAGNWSLLSWYLSLLAEYPVMTKAVTSALLTLVGDMICQIVIDQVPSIDLKRTFRFTLLGLVLVGPTLHFWYLYLSKLVTIPGASGAFLRLLLDQFIFAPIFIGTFLSALLTLEGRPSHAIPKLQQEWFSSVLVNWQLWIPFQFFNFRFVPQQFQKNRYGYGENEGSSSVRTRSSFSDEPINEKPITSSNAGQLHPKPIFLRSTLLKMMSPRIIRRNSKEKEPVLFTGFANTVRMGPKFSETVKGKLSVGAKIIKNGGRDNIFRGMFCERSISVHSSSEGIIRFPYKLSIPVKKIKGAHESENMNNPAQKVGLLE
ncbi:protein sym-1 [Phtheirospermum japonicum]|uniref:Protein sym-1 n=1 Tax=Phtheirospermum japonicum TaxID=374723 RepID=A0A830BZ70_9LAMI|nr:protein sym-1 [Phtheirospermum japonicum]